MAIFTVGSRIDQIKNQAVKAAMEKKYKKAKLGTAIPFVAGAIAAVGLTIAAVVLSQVGGKGTGAIRNICQWGAVGGFGVATLSAIARGGRMYRISILVDRQLGTKLLAKAKSMQLIAERARDIVGDAANQKEAKKHMGKATEAGAWVESARRQNHGDNITEVEQVFRQILEAGVTARGAYDKLPKE